VRWETERLFDGKLRREYTYQKLSKSGNWFSSYSQKCRGCFFETQCIITVSHIIGNRRHVWFWKLKSRIILYFIYLLSIYKPKCVYCIFCYVCVCVFFIAVLISLTLHFINRTDSVY